MKLSKIANVENYEHPVWYSSKAITNILALKNVIKQYRVTYDSDELVSFVVHRERLGYPNLIFEMHKSGLHYYDPRKQHFTFWRQSMVTRHCLPSDNSPEQRRLGNSTCPFPIHR